MEVYYKALLVLSVKVPGELYNAPQGNSPIKAWQASEIIIKVA